MKKDAWTEPKTGSSSLRMGYLMRNEWRGRVCGVCVQRLDWQRCTPMTPELLLCCCGGCGQPCRNIVHLFHDPCYTCDAPPFQISDTGKLASSFKLQRTASLTGRTIRGPAGIFSKRQPFRELTRVTTTKMLQVQVSRPSSWCDVHA